MLPESRVDGEMRQFLDWCEREGDTNPILKAGITDRFYSMSAQIESERSEYYLHLNRSNVKDLPPPVNYHRAFRHIVSAMTAIVLSDFEGLSSYKVELDDGTIKNVVHALNNRRDVLYSQLNTHDEFSR